MVKNLFALDVNLEEHTEYENFKMGTRGSKLALWQAEYAAAQLQQQNPDIMVQIEIIKTTGDKVLDVALSKIGDKGLFTKNWKLN
jgi:hydroxymethylbilane synthase